MLTDTQLVLISAAAQRDDHLITPKETLKGRAAQMVFTAMIQKGFADEVIVTCTQPHWRTDGDGQRVGLRITAAALTELGIDAEEPGSDPANPVVVSQPDRQPPVMIKTEARSGSKKVLLLNLLQREQGATLEEMVQATGWLPHTTRAALTRLRHEGWALERIKAASGSCYRICQDAQA
jgi:hypothetical protein